ncbi:MAG: hypothetical protein R3D67_18895 [Hyphomicrobiaceae bacterium]
MMEERAYFQRLATHLASNLFATSGKNGLTEMNDAAPSTSTLASSPASRPGPATHTVPSGLQATRELSRRRWLMLGLNLATWFAMMWVAATILSAGGWSVLDYVLLACFAVGTPWTVVGFWNAVIGLWLLHFHKDPVGAVAPFAAAGDAATAITTKPRSS